MESFEEHFKEIHRGDLSTLLKIYWENKPIYKSPYLWVSFIISIITFSFPFFIPISKNEAIELLGNTAISVFPSILGFSLGGYILIISLNSSKVLNEVTEPNLAKGEKYSFYQKMSSVFAFSLLLQALTIVCGMILIIISKIGKPIILNYWIAESLNSIALFFMSFIISYSTLLIGQIVLNIFNYGQVLHFLVRIDKLEEDENLKNKSDNANSIFENNLRKFY